MVRVWNLGTSYSEEAVRDIEEQREADRRQEEERRAAERHIEQIRRAVERQREEQRAVERWTAEQHALERQKDKERLAAARQCENENVHCLEQLTLCPSDNSSTLQSAVDEENQGKAQSSSS